MPSLRGGPCSASADRGRALIDRRGHYVDSYISEPLVTMTYLLALDQGTSSSRSIVFDEGGHIVEQDPLEIWRTQLATARDALAKAGIAASAVRAVGITNQRETTVLWNRQTGQPVHHAIVWQDRRAEPACAQLREQGHAATIQAKTGLLVDAYFSGTKLQWLLDHVPGARDAAERGELA